MRLITKPYISICFLVIVSLSSRLHAQVPEGCELQLNRVVENRATQPDAETALLQLADPISQFTCFIEEAGAIKSLVVPVKKKSLKEVLAAIQSQTNSGNQQQGTSVSSSATTDTVSKPSGPSAFIQNFGGISESTSGSSATYQWNPGTLINNLTTGELVPLCNSSLLVKDDCFSGTLAKILVPMTLSVTSNTSNSAQSLTATAVSTGSTSSAQQVNVTSKGTINPSFGGFSVKYVPWKFYTRQAKVPTSTKAQYVQADADIHTLRAWFKNCDAFTKVWVPKFQSDLDAAFNQHAAGDPTALKAAIEKVVADDYPKAFDALLKATPASTGCYSQEEVERQLSPFLTDLLAIDAAIDLAKSSSPILGFEYDLSTPQNLVSYSTVKANFSIQFPSPKTKSADQQNGTKDTAATDTISASAQNIKNAVNGAKSGSTNNTTPPCTFTAFFGGAFYNSSPSSSIPSASLLRDIQGGAEFSYLAPSSKLHGIGSLIGNTTLAAAYYYQDQTSPAILSGLPSTITFTGLPSDANTVFAKRGVINLAQVRLGFGSGKNITFPLSATYSNRTELITHPTWGLQFGFNYNLSSLLTSTGGTK
jgi:hypothetical protein